MLHCTPAAASTLDLVRRQQGVPDTFGVRLSAAEGNSGDIAVRMGFVPAPESGDEVTEEHGQRLFVAPELAPVVADMELDSAERSDGNTPGLLLRRSALDA